MAEGEIVRNPKKGLTDVHRLAWVKEMQRLTKDCAQRTGMRQELMVGQIIGEVGYGTSVYGNNLFNIKPGKGWKGEVVVNPGDGQEYRKYASPEDCVRDYENIIMTDPRYAALRDPAVRSDIKKAAEALKPWAPERPDYDKDILNIIQGPTGSKTFRKLWAQANQGLEYKPAQGPDEAPNYVPGVAE